MDITTIVDGLLWTIRRGGILPLLQDSASLCLRPMLNLCERLCEANRSLQEVATFRLSARLGSLLMRLTANCGGRVGEGLRLGVCRS